MKSNRGEGDENSEGDEKVNTSEKQVCRSGAFGSIAKLALELAQSVEQVGYQGGGFISNSAVQVRWSPTRHSRYSRLEKVVRARPLF